jgi:hypothetical protein
MTKASGNIDALIERCARLKRANVATFQPFLRRPGVFLDVRGHGPWDEITTIQDAAGSRDATGGEIVSFHEAGRPFFAGYTMAGGQVTPSDIYDKVRKIYECANILEFRAKYVPEGDAQRQEIHLHNANFCGQHQLCRICASRREQQLRKRFETPIKDAALKYPWAYLLTLTVRDGADLAERIETLKKSTRAFVRQGQRRKDGRSRGEWGKVGAAFSSMEIKRGENSGQWHVHSHAVLFTKRQMDFRVYDVAYRDELTEIYGPGKIPKSELKRAELNHVMVDGKEYAVSKVSAEWITASRGEGLSIQFGGKVGPKRITGTPQEVFDKVKNQVLKYNVKFAPADRADIPVLVRDTFNRRFLVTYGDFRNINTEDLKDEDAGAKEIFISQWRDGQYSAPLPSLRPIEPDMDAVKKKYLGAQALIIGNYRTDRRKEAAYHHARGLGERLAGVLDQIKADFRSGLDALWRRYRGEVRRRDDISRLEPPKQMELDFGFVAQDCPKSAFAL